MNVNYIINIKVCTAEKSVLTNKYLLKKIISFMGKEKMLECRVCGRVLKYQVFTQIVECEYKKYINCEACEKNYFCSDECLESEKEYNNVRFCVLLYSVLILFLFLLTILIIVLMVR